jgi:CheY-like chemotaxis protein
MLPREARESQPTPPQPARGDGPLVLVIDDEASARDLLSRMLEKEGYRVEAAANGQEGLARAGREPIPAAITLDVLMPGMDGWQVLSALKANPATAAIPVAMLSMLDNTGLGFSLGASAFLTKPVERERLAGVLREHIHVTRGSVLVVDDDDASRALVRRQLTGGGWDFREAANGEEALASVTQQKPDLIILDLVMPVLDGFGVLAALHADEAWRSIPVIVLTGRDLDDGDREALNGGVRRVLQKGSVSRDILLAEVRELLAKATATGGTDA